jgi:hypothetical protein
MAAMLVLPSSLPPFVFAVAFPIVCSCPRFCRCCFRCCCCCFCCCSCSCLFLQLQLQLPLFVFAVILSEAKDPEASHPPPSPEPFSQQTSSEERRMTVPAIGRTSRSRHTNHEVIASAQESPHGQRTIPRKILSSPKSHKPFQPKELLVAYFSAQFSIIELRENVLPKESEHRVSPFVRRIYP